MSTTSLEESGDARALHTAVLESLEAYLYVLDMIRPTPSNDCGDPGAASALVTLTRLGDALKLFPKRRLDPDPFTVGATPTIPLNNRPMIGTSMHDLFLRAAGRGYDALRIVPTYTFTDPNTGEPFEGTISTRGSSHTTTLREIISPDWHHKYTAEQLDAPQTIQHCGPPDHFHFTERVWDEKLWGSLRIGIIEQHIDFHQRQMPSPTQFLDAVWPVLSQEYDYALRHPLPIANTAPTVPQSEEPKSNGKGKDINGRMLTALMKQPDSRGWSKRQWADYLKCSDSSVGESQAWRDLQKFREESRAEATDRMDRTRTGRKKSRHKPAA